MAYTDPDILIAEPGYTGDGKALFWLALKTGLLTVVTLGIYRFWGKTRIRRYIWSSARLDGSRFEYTGTGIEMFLGFLLAVVFLAVYLGIIQMLLVFFGMTIFVEPKTTAQAVAQGLGGAITFLAVVPFIFFAIYRARRYKLARTRWRGIRFGMDKAAWGYAFRAMGYSLLTLLSLGLLLPLQTYRLEKYMTDRTWFGDIRFSQHGDWKELYGVMKHVFIGVAILVVATISAIMAAERGGGFIMLSVLAFPVGGIWLLVGMISYRVQSFGWLTRRKELGGEVRFDATPQTGHIILTYIMGWLLVGVAVSIAFSVLGGVAVALMAGMADTLDALDSMQFSPALILPGIILFGGYVTILVGAEAGSLAMISQPILKHYIETLAVVNVGRLTEVHQRMADTGADAEGFADALDIGGAF